MRVGLVMAVGLVSASAALASPAMAQTAFGGPTNTLVGTVTDGLVSDFGLPPTFSGSTGNTPATPDTATITLNSSRAILNLSSLNLTPEDTLNIVCGASTDTILLRVNAGAATINGPIAAGIGAPSATGCNVGIVSPGGVVLGPNASISAGGLLTTTADIADTDFFSGNLTFAGAPAGSEVIAQSGASVQASGVVAFVAPNVTSAATVTGLDTDVVYGSAESYKMTLASSGLDLLGFDALTASAGTISLSNATGPSTWVASLSTASAPVVLDGVEATGNAASQSGDVVVASGGGLSRAAGAPMQPVANPGAAPQSAIFTSSSGGSAAVASAGIRSVTTGNTRIDQPLTAGGDVALSTGGHFVNNSGAGAISAGKWGVYAPDPSGHTYGGLNSGNTALWGATVDTLPPSAFTGNRYVFANRPTLTFTAPDVEKKYGTNLTGLLLYDVTGYQPGQTGAYAGDDASSAFSGAPSVTSNGAPQKAMVGGSPYPISIGNGTMTNLAGYQFEFVDGSMDVVPCVGSAGCPDETEPAITFAQPQANGAGWHNAAATVSVTADGGFSGIYSLACKLGTQPITLTNVSSTAEARSADIAVPDEGIHSVTCYAEDGAGNTGEGTDTVQIDKQAPNPPTISANRSPEYTSGGVDWYQGAATLSFSSAGDPPLADGNLGSGVDSVPASESRSTTGALTVSGTAKDRAGNQSSVASKTVQVDATNPSLSITCPESVYLNGTATVTAVASDAESGLRNDPSNNTSVDTSKAGPATVTATAIDNVGNATTKSCTTTVVYRFGGFRQPINADGSSVFKLGSTVPVKFGLTDANGVPVTGAHATLTVAKLTSTVEGEVLEAVSTAAATTGNEFRYDGSGQYIFNLSTKPLEKGTWRLKATLDDGTVRTAQISLR